MARFTAVVDVAASVEQVWQRITDWPEHGRWIPLTTVRVTSARPDGLGSTFVGRSGLGPIGFDDASSGLCQRLYRRSEKRGRSGRGSLSGIETGR